jgi:hypothetical protein
VENKNMENYRLDPFSDEFGPLKRKVKDGDPVLKIIYNKAEEEVKGLAQKNISRDSDRRRDRTL